MSIGTGKGENFSRRKNTCACARVSILSYVLTLTVNGQALSDFGAGTVTITLPLTPAGGEYAAWYLAGDGSLVRMATSFTNGRLSFTTTHFSVYIITREPRPFSDVPVDVWHMVTLFWRCRREPAAKSADLSGFDDKDQVSGWAADAFAWAVSEGIINGKGAGLLDPKGTATRAEVAQIVMNYGQHSYAAHVLYYIFYII